MVFPPPPNPRPAASDRRPRPWLGRLLLLMVGGLVIRAFLTGIDAVPFHGDESIWIASSDYLELFLQGDLASPRWGVNYVTLTQPPLVRYVIGLGRALGGFSPADLNVPWDWGLDEAANRLAGAIPSPDLLWWSRLPMAALAIVAVLIAMYLLTRSAGWPAACLFGVLASGDAFLLRSLRRAMGEAPLLGATLLAAWATARALDAWGRALEEDAPAGALGRAAPWAAIAGLCAGLAGAAKPNGLVMALAVVLSFAAPAWLRRSHLPPLRRLAPLALLVGLALLGAAVGFIGPNPFLYTQPFARSLLMLDQRVLEMGQQMTDWPAAHISGLLQRVRLVPWRVLHDYAALDGDWFPLVNGVAALAGAGVLARGAWAWLRQGVGRPHGAALLVTALVTSLPGLLTPLDYERYFLFPAFFATVCIAPGLVALGRALLEWLSAWWRARPARLGSPS